MVQPEPIDSSRVRTISHHGHLAQTSVVLSPIWLPVHQAPARRCGSDSPAADACPVPFSKYHVYSCGMCVGGFCAPRQHDRGRPTGLYFWLPRPTMLPLPYHMSSLLDCCCSGSVPSDDVLNLAPFLM